MTDNTSIRFALNNLKNEVYDTREHGYSISKNPNDGTINTPTPCAQSLIDPNQVEIPFRGNVIGGMHTHFPSNDPETITHYHMFSDQDIYALFLIAAYHNNNGNPKNYQEYVLTLTNTTGTFAIKIKDWVKFATFINSDDWKERAGKHVLSELAKKYNDFNQSTGFNEYANSFLKVLIDFDAGIGLYQADDNYNWSELTKDPATNSLTANPIKVPCQ